ncbi:MAG: PorT family protein [Mediterranea sp.]|jgi:hypothetical protein|nr:PorT family protein [Mediterranea sp.]
MKRNVLLFVFVLIAAAASAQISWNAKAGMNLSNITGVEGDFKIGYNVGAGMEYAFSSTWSLQPSLLFTAKGAKESSDGITTTINSLYLELPILAAARFPINPKTNIVISAGPYLAYGVGGKTSVSVDGIKVSLDTFGTTTVDGESGEGLKRFDAGLAAGIALEFNKIVVGLNGEYGLLDVAETEGNESYKNLNLYLGIGYKF